MAVLIGVSDYDHPDSLPALPAVRANVDALAVTLTHPEFGGFDAERCVKVLDPADRRSIGDALRRHAALATDTLLIYYAGHGLAAAGDVHLTVTSTNRTDPFSDVLKFDDLRTFLLAHDEISNRVVILDCCYAGAAHPEMGPDDSFAELTDIAGVHLLTATGPTARAVAPPGSRYTAFTGALIQELREGVPGGPELLTLENVFQRVRARLRQTGRPLPQQSSKGDTGRLALVRNRAWTPPETDREGESGTDGGPAPESLLPYLAGPALATLGGLGLFAAGAGPVSASLATSVTSVALTTVFGIVLRRQR